jgi:formate dehydrogenase iron-sulfur subunit
VTTGDGSTGGVTTVYVPRDSSARSVGADQVATAIQQQATARGAAVEIVRNGSRGMMWLEPLVEVVTAHGRVGYGPVTTGDVEGLLDSGFLEGGAHELGHGRTDQIPWLAQQERLTFGRVGLIDPLSTRDYQAYGGLTALHRALSMTPEQICDTVTASGLRGRGGAGFPVGVKWRTVLDAPASPKFVTCNADEGDSGTFADRMLMEGDPFMLIEGMIIAGIAVDAHEGFIYIRSEYPDAVATMREALQVAYQSGWLGADVLGSGHRFDLEIRVGAGAYICGEETAMLESLEGKRGVVRAKPPLPALEGLFGRPTVVNNVLSLASVLVVLARGAGFYRDFGVGHSRGTQVFQLAGNVERGGIVETAFGITLGQMLERFGGGTLSGRPVRAVQVGGPLGAYLPPTQFDLPLDYEAFAEAGAMVGHGGIVVFDDTVDMAAQARFAMEFCAAESCGKCTPCRVGAVRGLEVIDRIVAGQDTAANVVLLQDLCEVMADGSLCAMGGLTPMPVRSVLQHFPQDLDRTAAQSQGAVQHRSDQPETDQHRSAEHQSDERKGARR